MSADQDDSDRAEVIDLRPKLDPEARDLWTRMFPDGIDKSVPGYGMELWTFGYACMVLHEVPDAVTRELKRLGCDDNEPLLYMRARLAGERARATANPATAHAGDGEAN